MDLKFTDEQNMFRDMTRNLCADYSGMDVVRKMEDDPVGLPTELWAQMQETGLLGILVPEEFGGMGLNMLDCAVILEEMGRTLTPGPFFSSSVMAALALTRAGSAEQKQALLPKIASGEAIVVPAWLEPDNGYGAAGVQMRARLEGNDYVLNGIKRHVFCARAAQQLIVLVRTGDGEQDVDLLLVDAAAAGLTYDQQLSMASDTQYRLTFDNVKVPAANRLGAAGSGWQAWNACMHDGIILLAAFAAGGAQQALDITVQYSKDRKQFDKPLGQFQALAHYMSDATTTVDGARMLVYEAAWAHSVGKDTARLAPMAKLFACKTFRDVTSMAQQVHGGIGFTLDYDIQLYYRRAKQLQLNWWDSRHLEELIAADILDRDLPRTIPDPFTV
ncbi:Acyl-CoA dehydrogenase domain protein [Sterolibacterium denitrificans]|uniref:Acyl-CoA dehydrogenase domain protein n=1 Tax=Sterolibacterium denitrificans TaxID=157592 RepID=A0A7Z7HPU1_9PROT|nr:acyl-CoA dehydrogenase family protein [Sterolibacterium denitrificans]SMB22683.1 Acyl-CoA dehydrogenase domain protein [Sterolibacterium denitrificans]